MKDIAEFAVWKVGDRIPKGRYDHLLNRYQKVLNFQRDNRVISIGTPALSPGPYRIILDAGDLARIETIGLFEREIVINDTICIAYTSEEIYRQPRKPEATPGIVSYRLIGELFKHMLDSESCDLVKVSQDVMVGESEFDMALRKRFLVAFQALWQGDELSFVQRMKGLGKGSTPSGDDFLVGYLIAMSWLIEVWGADLHARREVVHHAALGANPLVNTFLDQARYLYLDQVWAEYLNCLAMNEEQMLYLKYNEIKAMGSTSGEDMLCGFLIGMLWNRQDTGGADLLERFRIKKVI